MKAFVIVMLLLNILSFNFRAQIIRGNKKRVPLTTKQEIFGIVVTAIFILWGVAILLFDWS